MTECILWANTENLQLVCSRTEHATQTWTGPNPLLVCSNRKQKTYLLLEGRNRSRNLLPLSAVSSSRKRLEQEFGNECTRQEKWQQGKGGRTISSRYRYEKGCLNQTQNNSITFHVRTPSDIKLIFWCSMTSCPVPGICLHMPHQSRLRHDTLMHH